MPYIFKLIFVSLFFFGFSIDTRAQKDSLNDISALIYLDSFVVTASRQGFDTNDFIDLVRNDSSFLEAFHNLRFISYKSTNDFNYFDKKGRTRASYTDTIVQTAKSNCRTMQYLSLSESGNYFKNRKKRKYNYFTSSMHDRLFYTHRKTCDNPELKIVAADASRFEKYVFELKKLIFRPGESANVPFIGDKTNIFDSSMRSFYDFNIKSEQFEEYDCYVFEAVVKPKFEQKNKVVIHHLKTYFDKETFQVIGRDYRLQHSAGIYQFDVSMNIELFKRGEKYYPKTIHYNGYWNVPIKKREAANFTLDFFDFQNQEL